MPPRAAEARGPPAGLVSGSSGRLGPPGAHLPPDQPALQGSGIERSRSPGDARPSQVLHQAAAVLSLAGQAVFVLLQLWHGPVRGHTAAHMAALGLAHSAITLLMLKFPVLYWRNRWEHGLGSSGLAAVPREALMSLLARAAFRRSFRDCMH